jgi:hypothetical protein
MTDEKRRMPRGLSRLVCFVKPVPGGRVFRGLTKDLSGVGVRVVIEEILEPGTQVEVEVKLPDQNTPVQFMGEVVWSRPVQDAQSSLIKATTETGIKVVHIDPKHLSLIKFYVTMSSPAP